MEILREIISKIDTSKSNLDGSRESFDNLTIHDVYKIAGTKIEEMCLEYNMSNFSLPKIKGYNSLVIYADSNIENKIYKYALKIHVYDKEEIKNLDAVHKLVSENNISPKIYYNYNIDYNSKNFIINIIVSERLVLFSDFEWTSLNQVKNSIITLIEKQ
jgi:hypothetical protein